MRRSRRLTALVTTLVATLLVPAAALAQPSFVELCHHTSDAAANGTEWVKLRVGARSLESHAAHGDGMPGEEVPGSNGSLVFDDDCIPVQTASSPPPETPPDPGPSDETVFAVAYSDLDASSEGYDPDVDVLIAKLVDGPDAAADGVLGAGDLVITSQYPTDFSLTGFGSFTTTEHTITAVNFVESYVCSVASGDHNFALSSGAGDFDLYQEWSWGAEATKLHDRITLAPAADDEIVVKPASPSQPSDSIDVDGSPDPVDDPFIEVETSCAAEG